jgi:hypothetical protein
LAFFPENQCYDQIFAKTPIFKIMASWSQPMARNKYLCIKISMVRWFDGWFQDPQMFDEACQKRVECRALNIPEELGQVSPKKQSFF